MAVIEETVGVDEHEESLVAHHFHDIDQQREAATLGMWLFLAQEVMFFGGMLAAYTVYRVSYPRTFVACSNEIGLTLGLTNTFVLLCSSFCMAMSVRSAMTSRKGPLIRWLIVTLLLGVVFLVIKGIEYHEKWTHFLVPGIRFHAQPWMPDPSRAELFFVLYFVLTGMHALHMVIGVCILTTLTILVVKKDKFLHGDYMPVELSGFYWHFVDIVWVFLFPLIYLVNRAAEFHH